MVPAPTTLAAAAVGLAYVDAKYSFAQDLAKGRMLLRAQLSLKLAAWRDRVSLFYTFETMARKQPNNIAYICDGERITWREAELQSRRIAHFLISKGLQRGDVVAVYMPNKLIFPLLCAGFFAADVVPAFINYNLTGKGLVHCVTVAKAKMVLFDGELESFIEEVASELGGAPLIRWRDQYSASTRAADLPNTTTLDQRILDQFSVEEIPHERRKGIDFSTPALLIYTSGTTGLPKAAVCAHGRVGMAQRIWPAINSFTAKDTIYTPMPLYHSTALFLAVFASWQGGSTVAIGRKFSATKFWDEVRAADATVVQYVGEICRYLLAVPPSKDDKKHRVRMAYGNGMRPDVWEKFRERFGVRTISEFFASTEGNLSLFNVNTGPFGAGAVGAGGKLYQLLRRNEEAIIRVDELTEEPARDAKGFCIQCGPNESGELISAIDMASPFKAFRGYHGNEAATKKKILNDVFVKGDAWFRTGDLLRRDADGHKYFGDRLGDTFRENVSTADVQAALGEVLDDCTVFGVLVPNADGRAGCAAIPKGSHAVDLKIVADHVTKRLPIYARPVFLRMVNSLDITGTGKHQKVKLRNEGIDPSTVKDPIYWLNKGTYEPFTKEDFAALQAGKIKL